MYNFNFSVGVPFGVGGSVIQCSMEFLEGDEENIAITVSKKQAEVSL